LKPRLDPAMGQIVICARVAQRLAFLEWRNHLPHMEHPSDAPVWAARKLPGDGFAMLRFALHSLSVYVEFGMNSVTWLESVLEAAHFGNSFRRCFFFDYKENRRPYPRVTNRGVQTSKGGRKSKHRRLLDSD